MHRIEPKLLLMEESDAMPRIKPKLLVKVDDGRIFTYTDALAERADMKPVWPDGVDPNPPEPEASAEPQGLTINVEQKRESSKAREIIDEKNKVIVEQERQINSLAAEVARLNEELAEATRKYTEVAEAVPAPVEPPPFREPVPEPVPEPVEDATITFEGEPVADNSGRMDAITGAVKQMISSGDEHSFTKKGDPRLPVIEKISGLKDVTGKERAQALKQLGKV